VQHVVQTVRGQPPCNASDEGPEYWLAASTLLALALVVSNAMTEDSVQPKSVRAT
jgi:hypothetical protein